jgi:phosphomethylpyrimidine synthase
VTQAQIAQRGDVSPQMIAAAQHEEVDPEVIREGLAAGTIVLPANHHHTNLRPIAIGAGLSIKINANIGTSTLDPTSEGALARLQAALDAGADAVMDLSTAGDLAAIRAEVVAVSPVPVGTVPIYEAAVKAVERGGGVESMEEDDLLRVIESHAAAGVDFVTVHCGVTQETSKLALDGSRLTGVVSRGGAFTICWMRAHGAENPLYARFDDLLDICREHDVMLSLGDGLRAGCLADGTDRAQVAETVVLGGLVLRARQAGVQAMVEGPGHLPLDQVAANVLLEKRLCHGAPFYVLSPLVTDIAPGYDHIVAAIGGAVAAAAGADFLCYVTPAEHLGLPTDDDVREGLIASKIAAHVADIVKGVPGARERDLELARARKRLDWETQRRLAIDPAKFAAVRKRRKSRTQACSMCGDFCAMRIVSEFLGSSGKADGECS